MDGEHILGMIIMGVCCFGCAVLFLCIGNHMQHIEKPAHFWTGSEIKPEWVNDIPGYNHENGKMWKCYAIPYLIAGTLSCLNWVHEGFIIASLTILVAAAFPGIWLLIHHYRKIERKYINLKKLDKVDPFC